MRILTAKETTVTVSVTAGFDKYENIAITNTTANKTESAYVETAVPEKPKADALDKSTITVTNNVAIQDVIELSGLTAKDIIKVYDADDKVLATATASKSDLIIKLASNCRQQKT